MLALAPRLAQYNGSISRECNELSRPAITIVLKRSPRPRRLAPCAALALLAGCGTLNADYDPTRSHHTAQGFRNLYPYQQPGLGDLLRWQWDKRTGPDVPPPAGGYAALPVLRPDLALLAANRDATTVTWIGHATILLQLGGVNVLTDPQFSERASPLGFAGPERKVRLPATLAELPRIDVVVISHNHYDHLDLASVRALAAQPGGSPLFLVPLGVDRWMREQGIARVQGMDWWQAVDVTPAVKVHFVPSHHWSARGLFDRFATLWGGYVVERAGARPWKFYFAGDTGYAPLFRNELRARFAPIDLAALPIGAYEPRWFMRNQHINPEEAVRIAGELEARQALAMHWGTFELTDEPLDQPPRDLAAALARAGVPPERFWVFKPGETRTLPGT